MAAEPITVRGVRLTSPTRVLYAEQGITKRELAEYYARIERWVVPELKDRPLTLLRCPAGREKECFVQRRATDSIGAAVKRVPVDVSDEPEGTEHLAVDSIEGLLSLVQLGVLELHTWGARRDRLDRPDRLIMDLDPAPDVEFAAVVEAAVEVRETLEALGLRSFVKSTGGKGLHVVAPLARRNHWDELRAAARALAHAIADGNPERYLATSSKAERRGRIFLDYMRNAPGATAIASYSTRARPGAPVSLPLGWDELDAGFDPGEWTLRTVPERLESISVSPWAGYDGTRQSITRAMMDALEIGG